VPVGDAHRPVSPAPRAALVPGRWRAARSSPRRRSPSALGSTSPTAPSTATSRARSTTERHTFTLGLVGCAAAAVPLGRVVDAARWARVAAIVGPLLVAVGVAAGLALGHSPSWFAAVGVPGNLLWLAGLIGLGRATARSRALPRWVAYALPLGLVALLPFGELGGSLLTAVVWGYVGVLLLDRTSVE
jgi:hypothetical protein